MLEQLIPLAAMGAAELGDKTQISILALSMRERSRLQLLVGAILAFLLVDGVAVLAGSWIKGLIPTKMVIIFSSIIFVALGAKTMLEQETQGIDKPRFRNPLVTSFTLVFIAEWLDKTQIVAGIMAARFDPLMILAESLIILGIVSAATISLGALISGKISRNLTLKISGAIFIAIGILWIMAEI